MDAPKLFISYSWSSVDHEQWVLELATRLRESGVDVILDKWHLKVGQDMFTFMEQMVTDKTILKVAIISDAVYSAKADDRSGGVGTETQIISKNVYENEKQEKFVAVIVEKDADGKVCLPTYYKSRVYIDMCDSERFEESFEQLLRWIYDKPLHVAPPLGQRPAFLSDAPTLTLGTTATLKRCIDAIKNNKPTASGAVDEYFTLFFENLERFRIEGNGANDYDEKIVDSIHDLLPFRNEAIELFTAIASYTSTSDFAQKVQRFLERLLTYTNAPRDRNTYWTWEADNFKFIVHELFLYALAVFLKFEKFEYAEALLGPKYYAQADENVGQFSLVNHEIFWWPLGTMEHRKKRLDLKRLSIRADLLLERSKSSGLEFRYLMQADFVAFLRSEMQTTKSTCSWFPETLIFSSRAYGAFEIFVRSTSKTYFAKVKPLIGMADSRT
ncbi:toll/interleukin-1 receptor domain-containing protein [Undibacterium umbellatum]|uniref:TIR domain-containing protein n=1 Tax=Undibacterium umbellatum TaxID=2762300 RepID=A0ABR6Z6Z8_9BURK|nr:toll/interleukin-1 receptor domain-containing protein [Undibacterium umbellatum]MBC3907394.1 TIR domain-containing protein [Undibacterium umbellatum]